MNWIYNLVVDEKAQLLKTVNDASLGDKTSVNGKVFVSFLYFFGKHVASHCRPAEWKEYFSLCFDAMWSLFPNWHELDQKGVLCSRGTGGKLSVKAFARVSAQSACRNNLKRMKRSSLAIEGAIFDG